MDARDRLRRYLEQRRELGESELVLDGMSVDEVLSMVSARGALKRRPRPEPGTVSDQTPVDASPPASRSTVADEPAEAARGSALPTAFAPSAGEHADSAEAPESMDEEDHDAPADHPRLRGDGDPSRAAPPPTTSRPEAVERGGYANDPSLDAAQGGDWRATLRATGGAPDAQRPASTPADPRPPAADLPSAPQESAPVPARRAAAPSSGSYVAGTPFPGLDDVTVGVVYEGTAPALLGSDDGIEALPDLAAIAARVQACTRCGLYKTATHGVPGEGNPNADFVVVGEAPGADEDASGRPFVGASGQLLTKILAAISLAREDVLICNVVKHRPPGNRNPAPDEVSACSPYLLRQLELVRPKVILTVGNFAAQTLLNTKLGIGKLRGQVHLYRGVPLVATYHPAALLRNPAWKRPTWEDVQLARRLLDRAAPG